MNVTKLIKTRLVMSTSIEVMSQPNVKMYW